MKSKGRVMRRAAIVAGLLLASPLEAAPMQNFRVNQWFAGSYSNDTTKMFSHCAAQARYNSGVLMLFSIGRNYDWNLSFAHPDWNLTQGEKFPIEFVVDGMSPVSAQAVAIHKDQVKVPLPDSVPLFQKFRKGNRLTVAAAGQTFHFSLTDTAQLLPALMRCVAANVPLPPGSMAKNPFAAANTAPLDASAPRSSVSSHGEATALMANVLSRSGIPGFELIAPAEIPTSLKADAVWKAGKTVGTLQIVESSKLQDVPAQLIASDAKSCRGEYFSGSAPDENGDGSVARVFTGCRSKETTTTIYYVAVPRPKGGFYLFATLDDGRGEAGTQPAKELDASIRKAVFQTVSNR